MYTTIAAPDIFSPHILEIGDIRKVLHISDCCEFSRQYVISPVRFVGATSFPNIPKSQCGYKPQCDLGAVA